MSERVVPPMTDVVGWDVRTWSLAVELWDRALGDDSVPLDVLEVGAGPGGPSLWLALRGHRVTCTNFDNTEALARPLHERYGVADRIEYRDLDILAGIPERERYDVVVFKSVLGGLGGQDPALAARAIESIGDALKPGGRLLFAENIRGTWVHRLARRIAYRMRRASWRFLPLAELRALLARFEAVEIHASGVLAVLGTSETRRDALARADQAFVNRAVPASWHYMAYGTALKPRGVAEPVPRAAAAS